MLPSLGNNIIRGNSLIDWDILESKLFDTIDERALAPMNFTSMFSEVFKNGGFDAIVGNPPYVVLQDEFRDDNQLSYFRRSFSVASYKLDTYHLFIERAVRLTRPGGLCSMITPANYLTNNYLSGLRRFLLQEASIKEIVVIDGGVFRGIREDNAIFTASPQPSRLESFPIVHSIPDHSTPDKDGLRETGCKEIVISRALADPHVLFTGAASKQRSSVWQKVGSLSRRLEDIAYVNFGKQLRDRKKYTKDVIEVSSEAGVPKGYRPCYTGRDVLRYKLDWSHLACLNDEVARSGGCWDSDRQDATSKLLTRQIGKHPEFAIDERGYQCLNTIFMINVLDSGYSALFVLGILNSTLVRAYWLDHFYDQRRTFPKIKGTYLKQLPIYRTAPTDKGSADQIILLVEQMIQTRSQLGSAHTERDKSFYENKCAILDRQIESIGL